MTVKERLIQFLKTQGIGQAAFERAVGLSNGYVNNIRKSIQPDKIERIALQFPDLNTGWLLTGEGSMLKSDAKEAPTQQLDSLAYYREIISSQQETIRNLSETIKILTSKK